MKEVMARFEHLKKSRGIMLLTGDPGMGKTCILRRMVKSLNPQNYHHCYTPHATISKIEIYRQLSVLFHLPQKFSKTALYQQLQQTINDIYKNQGKIPCIILDECHLMDDATLEELVLLTNFEMDSKIPFILILAGLNELRERLKRRRHEPLNQRITFRYHMEGLVVEDTKRFIDHRLKVAGRSDPLFEDKAYELIHALAMGIPRKIDAFCYQSMLVGALQGANKISADMVHKAAGGM